MSNIPGFHFERDMRIVAATQRLINTHGIAFLSRTAIAREAGMAPSSVSNFGLRAITNSPNPKENYKTRILRGLLNDAIDRKDVAMIRTVIMADSRIKPDPIPAYLRTAAGL